MDLKMVIHWENLPPYFHDVRRFGQLISVLSIHSYYSAWLLQCATGCSESDALSVLDHMTSLGLTTHYWEVRRAQSKSPDFVVCRSEPKFPMRVQMGDRWHTIKEGRAIVSHAYKLKDAEY